MPADSSVNIQINLARIRQNARDIATRVGVPIWAVVKANAYGLGAAQVAEALADVVSGFCVFSVDEAAEYQLWNRTGMPSLVLGPPDADVQTYRQLHLRPTISTIEQALALRDADPVLNVDTGMHRFSCKRDQVESVLTTGACREAMTHATRLEQAIALRELLGGRGLTLHAAATALLDQPSAWLDLVRPGLAFYQNAVQVSTPLVEVHDSRGPAGYTGFVTARHGVVLRGYAHGLRTGPFSMNGQPRRILEVGMQTAFVEIGPSDRVNDRVILLGAGVTETELARAWQCTPHEVMLRLAGSNGKRIYIND